MSFGNFTKGDTVTYNVTWSAPGGGALDLTGMTLYMTLKTSLALADNAPLPDALQITGTITGDPTLGAGSFLFESDQTKQLTAGAKYFYDVQVHDASVPPVVSTTENGSITVIADVTNTDA